MPAIKLHVYRGENDGTDSCDFRGDAFIGSPVDEHRTVVEVDPADDSMIEFTLQVGPGMNEIFSKLRGAQPEGIENIASALGLAGEGPIGLRIGVWDE